MKHAKPYRCGRCTSPLRPAAKDCPSCGVCTRFEERYAFRCDRCRRGMHEAYQDSEGHDLCGVCHHGAKEPSSFAK